MHFINRCHSSLLKATLTQRVCRHITITNLSPRSAVLNVHISFAFVFVVAFVLFFLVLFTILFLGKVRTAGEGTGSFRLSWQVPHLLLGIRKALRISPQGFQSLFHCLYYSRCPYCNSMEFTVNFQEFQKFLRLYSSS